MKTIQDFYNEIKSNAELAQAFEKAIDEGKLVEFAKQNGVEASEEEIAAVFSNM